MTVLLVLYVLYCTAVLLVLPDGVEGKSEFDLQVAKIKIVRPYSDRLKR